MNDFISPVLLRNAHLQSLLSSTKARQPLVRYRARNLTEHSVSVLLDCGQGIRLQGCLSEHGDGEHDLVILIHGWEGSADSLYLLSAAAYLWEKGFDVFRLNLRDHGSSHHLNPKLFHSCRLDEVVGAVKQVQQRFPRKRMYLGGFSLGGNFALRVAVRAPEADIHLSKVVAVCPVLNPAKSMDIIENGWSAYHSYFLEKWRCSLRKKREYFPELIGLKDLSRFKSLNQMTVYFVHHHTEFPNLKAYLNGYAITGDALKGLTVPTTIIASADDPVIPADDLGNLAKPECLELNIAQYGGHCGFIENYQLTSWADRKMAELFRNFQ